MKVSSLICKRHIPCGTLCLGSLMRCAPDASLTLFEDGSLSDGDVEKLQSDLSPARIVRRAEVDEQMNTLLARHPHCRKYRDEQPVGLKLFDIPFLTDGDSVYFDCDIFFFRAFDPEALLVAARDRFVFMLDINEGYSGSLARLVWRYQMKMASKINAGIIAFPRALHDLDFIEWFLSIPEFQAIPHMAEQTCFAAMAGMRCDIVAPRQVGCVTRKTVGPGDYVALHFIANQKARLSEFLMNSTKEENAPPVKLLLDPPRLLNARRILMHVIGRRIFPSTLNH